MNSIVFLAAISFGQDMTLPLLWMPAQNIAELSPVPIGKLNAIKVAVNVVDVREKTNEIGRNTKREKPRLYLTNDSVAAWFAEQFKYILRHFKINVADSGAPEVTFDVQLKKFYVEEGKMYEGEIAFKIAALSLEKKELWSGTITSGVSRWGLSFKKDNYRKCLCNAFLEAVYSLLKTSDFISAFDTY
jgi:hypothetical protein